MQQVIPHSQEVLFNIESGFQTYAESSDPRVENLVRMFSSQLFKRSFINTSLMIIQKKMNEKLLQKTKQQQEKERQAVKEQVVRD